MDFPENYLIDLDKDLFKGALRRVEDSFSKNLGNVENFNFPYNHDTATTSFENFLKIALNFLDLTKMLYQKLIQVCFIQY